MSNLLRKFIAPFWYSKFGFSNKLKYYKYMKDNQWNSIEENRQLQKKFLYKTIKYSFNNIPYYNNLEIDIDNFTKNTIFDDIKQIPILTKKELREEFNNLYIKRNNLEIFPETSGGSTGEPVKFMKDNDIQQWGVATKILYNEWAGRKLHDPMIKLWGSERDIFKQRKSIKSRVSSWIRNQKLLNAFRMSEEDMRNYIKEINSYRPKLVLAYVQSIYELAKFIKFNNLDVYSPRSIMTSAGVLYPKYRSLIEEVFDCQVFNRYGSREVGDMACDCEKHEGLHLNLFNHYIEIIDEDGNRCAPGEKGEIVITTLRNKTMPLIRYKIGDMGVLSNNKCSCNRGLPMLKKVIGRTTDVFETKDGELIDGEYFTHLIYFKEYINEFQFIQTSKTCIVVKLVLDNEKEFDRNKEEFNEICKKIKLVMGKETEVKYKLVDEIEPSNSGKYRYTISDVR